MNTTDLVYNAIANHDWEGMKLYMSRMNILDFRRIQTQLRKKILPSLTNDDFWNTYLHLIKYKKAAFLACATAAERLAQDEIIDFNNEHIKQLSLYLHSQYPEAIVSLMNILIPILTQERQIESLFEAFNVDYRTRIAVLLKHNSPIVYYMLFKTLCHHHESKELIGKCCLFIIKKKDDMSLNMAYIMKEYFDLNDVKCPKSLNIERYELSYIERNYDNFLNVLLGKRPKL
ncbi:MAG: hypothetical protein K6E54_00880 [Bacteroidaceae bacterium]|nr:hypothetical protein [Bacteroidaceae bacterium]